MFTRESDHRPAILVRATGVGAINRQLRAWHGSAQHHTALGKGAGAVQRKRGRRWRLRWLWLSLNHLRRRRLGRCGRFARGARGQQHSDQSANQPHAFFSA
jgi:hypothetical protein